MATTNFDPSIYNIQKMTNDVVKKYIPDESEDTLALGTFGYLQDIFSLQIQNDIILNSELGNELWPSRAKYEKNVEGACMAILEFNKGLIDSVCDIVPAVKPQIAFYEMFGVEGIKVFNETCKYAKEKGMCVIADVKRGDIGTTAAGYSNAYLGKTPLCDEKVSMFDVDFVTVIGCESVAEDLKPTVRKILDMFEENKRLKSKMIKER